MKKSVALSIIGLLILIAAGEFVYFSWLNRNISLTSGAPTLCTDNNTPPRNDSTEEGMMGRGNRNALLTSSVMTNEYTGMVKEITKDSGGCSVSITIAHTDGNTQPFCINEADREKVVAKRTMTIPSGAPFSEFAGEDEISLTDLQPGTHVQVSERRDMTSPSGNLLLLIITDVGSQTP
jgi:hypothetical protein